MSHTSGVVPLHKTLAQCLSAVQHLSILPLLIKLLCCFDNFCCRSQTPHPGRIEPAHNILQQHSSSVHGNQSLCDTGSPLPQRNANTQSSRLQGEGSFGLGSAGAPGGEGADHALDVSRRVLSRCFKAMASFRGKYLSDIYCRCLPKEHFSRWKNTFTH